jgi:hypothetical protein
MFFAHAVDKIERSDWRVGPVFVTFTVEMKYTQTTLDKIERVLDEAEYIVRYERGNFQSGYCILEQKKVVVLNKFLQLEGRINTLVDIIPQLKITPEDLTPEVRKIYDDVLAMHHSIE